MTDEKIKDAILNSDSDLITECEVEIETAFKTSRIYTIKGGITARYTYIHFAHYPQGIVLNSMPKNQIEIIKPEHRDIHKTDWSDSPKIDEVA